MKLLQGKKARIFLLIFLLSIAVVTVAIIFFVRTFCFYTVTFVTNTTGQVASYRVLRGFSGHDPEAKLRKVGYYFIEWCVDKECTTPYDFSTKVMDNVTLYARWGEANAVLLKYADGEKEEYITQSQLDDYVNYLKPGSKSTVDIYTNQYGYKFVWFENSNMSGKYYTEPHTFDLSNGDITLYGAWCDVGEDNWVTEEVDYCGICGERGSGDIKNNTLCKVCNNPVFKVKYIKQYNGTCRNVIVPQKIGNKFVRGSSNGISEEGVFYDAKDYLKKVIFEAGFEKIGNYTFANCEKLEFIIMGDDITHIGNHAFDRCSSLENVKFSSNIVEFGDYAFYQANKLLRVNIPDSCVYVGKCAFLQTNITNVNIPGSVKTIGDRAFASCERLNKVLLHEGLERIGCEAFANTSIDSIHIPRTVKVMGNSDSVNVADRQAGSVFNFNSKLKTITIDENNNYFLAEDNVIYNKSSDGVLDKTILYFYPRAKTDTVFTVPESVVSIDDSAFIGASNLIEVYIGSHVTNIGAKAFRDCANLKKVYISSGDEFVTVNREAFSNCPALCDVRLERVETLHSNAFQGCTSLIEIVLPADVVVKDGVFYGCKTLYKIVLLGKLGLTETSYPTLLLGVSTNLNIYVPQNVINLVQGRFELYPTLKPYVDGGALRTYTDISECNLIYYQTNPNN